ncbi:MAG: glutamate synthase large subunit [Pirellula sp.]
MNTPYGFPHKQGLYDPELEKDSCGVGFVANVKGVPSHQIVCDADTILKNMDHRGACGCEQNTGDGAGILVGLPDKFLRRVAKQLFGTELPSKGLWAAGNIFFPKIASERDKCRRLFNRLIESEGQTLIGWRDVPQQPDLADIGPTARSAEPWTEQVFIRAADGITSEEFERKLYAIRKQASHALRNDCTMEQASLFYVCSLSTKTLIYKGMLTPAQVVPYYPDLSEEDFETHLAMVHSRFSTNTFPSWDRAQPLRFMSHNGEINTLRGNINWMRAREGMARSELFGAELKKLFPVVEPMCSDSGTFDNVLEFLLMNGRTLQEAIMMMVPEAWQKHDTMSQEKKAFYEYFSCLMEPWDGPASIVFTDGKYIGATLDRNGLRPSRYYLTTDDRVIMASEVGVLPVDPAIVKEKGRLQPGRMFLIDFDQGRLIPDEELKSSFAAKRNYQEWLRNGRITLDQLTKAKEWHGFYPETLLPRMQAFGYTIETMHFMLVPMIQTQVDPIGSMGNDSAIACLSDQPRLVYDYFKQLFAQVTNPAIDSIREDVIMSLECYIGPEKNLLEATPEHCHRLLIHHPILTNEELGALKHMDIRGWKTATIDITFDRSEGKAGLQATLDRICAQAEKAIDDGYTLVLLSDRAISRDRVAISSLLACGAVHQHLVKVAKRTAIGIIVETGEAREVHHHCLLIGFGADAINPYLAFESLWQASLDGMLEEKDEEKIVSQYRKAVAKGMLKVMAKMGISTLASYKGAQIFEALGLQDEVIDRCFKGTSSRIQGCGFDVLAEETLRRHALAFPTDRADAWSMLPNVGEFHWRAEGEKHGWDPAAIADIQVAARNGDKNAYRRFADHINQDARMRYALRGLFEFQSTRDPVPIEKVQSAKEIVKRFCTGAMSLGSISSEAHETLAIAMNRLGGKSNTGEGGEDPVRYKLLPNGDSKRSAIKQVASGRFGVTIEYLANADELQIKISQGAKPGEGGELPGKKVDKYIARIRYSTPGVGLISPPPHHDIYSIEDLAQLIHDLKNANPSARVSVKLVSEVGVGVVASGVAKAHADHILISGDTGGTGASPLTSIKHAGLPWELGIAEAHQTLVMNNLRSRVTLQTDGGLKTGRDVVIAALLGAEEFGFATAPLITLGCIMMRKCHLNTCPVGIATQDPELRAKFAGKPEHVVNYLFMVAEDAREIMASLGFMSIDEMVGRTDCLKVDHAIKHWKTDGLDLTPILKPAKGPTADTIMHRAIPQDHGLEKSLDMQVLLPRCRRTIETGEAIRLDLPIINTNRTVGTILSHNIAKKYGQNGLPTDTIHIRFRGSAGQSFGAFLAHGVTLELEGDANDYVGKGLSGGRIAIYPDRRAGFKAEDNIIIGNVCLYGATMGELFVRGRAAERFAVRNSGCTAVIEGVGDHGCEYMTGGRVLILGPTGRNFAAGMSGGIAYVLDDINALRIRTNLGTVELEPLVDSQDILEVHSLVSSHAEMTQSPIAKKLLEQWEASVATFVKVIPTDYKRVLAEQSTQSVLQGTASGNGNVSVASAKATK